MKIVMNSRAMSCALAAIVAVAWSWCGTWQQGRAAERIGNESVVACPTTVIDEHFLNALAPSPLHGFRAYDGTWRATDGVLYAEPAAGSKLILDELVLATGEVGCEVLFPDDRGGSAGLIVKVGRLGIGADAFDGYEVALDPHSQCLRLGRHVQNFQLLRHVPCAVPVDHWISLVVRMSETGLVILVDGDIVVEYEDTQQPLREGGIGFRPWMRNVQFRNLWVVAEGQRRSIPLADNVLDRPQLCCGWTAATRETAEGRFTVAPQQLGDVIRHVQQVTYVAGVGEVGIRRQAADAGWELSQGEVFRGYVEVRCPQPTDLYVALESGEGEIAAESQLCAADEGWQRLAFTLLPVTEASDVALVLKLKSPGTFQVRRLWCEPTDALWPATLATDNLPAIAFITRHALSAPPAVGQDLWAAQPRAPGCSIRLLDPRHPERAPQAIFSDASGCIYDLNISPDAKTLYFSYRRDTEKSWHIWRIQTDGTGLQQLTDGPHYDVSPCELPDGGLVFVSTRRFGYTVCQPGPASNLFRMDADGSNIRCVSMNTLSDLSPQMLPDGRILFTRWEYIDRDLTYRQSLWTEYPDGSAYQLYFGNTIRNVGTFWQARPLPGNSEQVVATFAPHHGFPHGAIGIIDRTSGVETREGVGFTYVTREFPVIEDRRLRVGLS